MFLFNGKRGTTHCEKLYFISDFERRERSIDFTMIFVSFFLSEGTFLDSKHSPISSSINKLFLPISTFQRTFLYPQ